MAWPSSLPYEYADLDGPRHIRLLKIFPDDYDRPLIGEFKHVSIAALPAYVALSYVWGNSNRDNVLYIGRRTLKIRENVNSALRVFRSAAGGTSWIWIDAVCINQEDTIERASQVSLIMQHIYERAEMVLVYLDQLEGCDEAHRLIHSVSAAVLDGLPFPASHLDAALDDSTKLLEEFEGRGVPRPSNPEWESIARFLSHPWFHRIWTLQECLVARHCMIIHNGQHFFAPELFRAVIFMLSAGLAREPRR